MTGSPLEPRDIDWDREIDAALAVEPSHQFLGRLRARIAGEPRPVLRRLPLILFAGGGVLAALLFALRLPGTAPAPAERSGTSPAAIGTATQPVPVPHAAAAVPAPVAAIGSGVSPATSGVPPAGMPRARAQNRRHRLAPTEPEVLISYSEQRALQGLLRTAAREPLKISHAPFDAVQDSEGPPRVIVVPAIAIAPLVPEPVEEGDSK
jgi:hypothetical protein